MVIMEGKADRYRQPVRLKGNTCEGYQYLLQQSHFFTRNFSQILQRGSRAAELVVWIVFSKRIVTSSQSAELDISRTLRQGCGCRGDGATTGRAGISFPSMLTD
jgi:hypothetical protein